jgi:putative transposase
MARLNRSEATVGSQSRQNATLIGLTLLTTLSEAFKNDYTLLCDGNASWHKSKDLKIPDNIRRFCIPPRTPEMNPIEQLRREIRKNGFKNVFHKSLDLVVEKLCDILSAPK